ncbi:uncharacterized protein LOC130591373 [Beta vulgaris subsp. vulgaris]|uniref:uncharacterized protein LOC130591373 n=1 Tax=Beta vulgaris subsp. vulgaris TaxID=3555 RepID=UPI002547F4F9|nr:uncharacterized protein LOC130591373 [Beta vulgaris subsp. vulgaris]
MVEMRNMMLQMQKDRQNDEARIESILAHNKMLMNQLAQLVTSNSTRQQGALPAQSIHPTDLANAITLRNGSHYNEPYMPTDDIVSVNNDGKRVQDESKTDKENSKQVTEHKETNKAKQHAIEIPLIKLPFPNRRSRVTVPFTELITQVPAYAKFMKDILTRKRAFNEVETVAFTEECSAFLQNKSPPKLKDPGSFSIPCHIGRLFIDKALCDLGASVSVMPLSVSSKLNMGILKVTNITLQMADRSVKYPLDILEDVPVRVGKNFIPVDFVVLDMEKDTQILIILARPFLHIVGVVIDVKNGKLTLSVGDDQVTFNLSTAVKSPMLEEKCYSIDVVDVICHDNMPQALSGDPLKAVLCLDFFSYEVSIWSNEIAAIEKALASEEVDLSECHKIKRLVQSACNTEVKKPELKPLPSHLKYVFFDEHELNLVIVSAALDNCQLSQLLTVLKTHKKVIGYSIDDLKGISPDFCMHRIHLEDDHKSCIQPQRRLNPNMQEVVKKEVMELLDACIIYSIADSKWVSPV